MPMITDFEVLLSTVAHKMAEAEGVDLNQFVYKPEWTLWHDRARVALEAVRQADQLRGFYPHD